MADTGHYKKRSKVSSIIKKIKKPIKKACTNFANNNEAFNNLYVKIIKGKRLAKYEKYVNLPIDNKLIIFESFVGSKYSDSPKAIYEHLVKNEDYNDYHFVWFFKEKYVEDYLFLENNPRTRVGLWGSPDYYKTYATAGYWVNNQRVPLDIGIRDGQAYVQCWHGTPLKRLGYDVQTAGTDARNKPKEVAEVYSQDAARYTYMLSPSAFCTEKFTSAFGLKMLGKEDIIIEEGYPRNDYIVNHSDEDVARIRKSLGIADGKKVILYAPTWRESQFKAGVGYTYESPIDFARLHDRLGDDYVVLFRAHYFIGNSFDFSAYGDYVINACNYPEINDLYIISDIMITDYSSVFFDYGILKRPILFFMYDLEYYRDDLRGFYIGLDELPGPIIEKEDELIDKLASVDSWFTEKEIQDKYKAFNDRFTYLDDGHAAERVVKRIIG